MKKIFLTLVLIMAVLMSACSNSNKPSSEAGTSTTLKETKATATCSSEKYTIEKATHKENNIEIKYPQISNLGNSDKEKKINELIKTEALAALDLYKDTIANLNLNLDFQIKYKGTDFLSIVYLGIAQVKGGMHPDHVIQTSTIELAKGETIVLADAARSEDEKFASKVIAGKYRTYDKSLDLEASGALKQIVDGYDSHSLMLTLKPYTAKFYLTKDSLGVSIGTSHAAGDHFEMEVEYKSLGDLLSIKPKGSEDLPADKTSNSSNSSTATATAIAKPSNDQVNREVPKELVEALCLSESLHFDSFNGQPDATTTNYLLHNVVSKKLFRWVDIVKMEDGEYYFSSGQESDSAAKTDAGYVPPNTLYKDYFESGKYVYPPQELSRLVGGTQTGIFINSLEVPFTAKVEYKGASKKGDLLLVNVKISRYSKLVGETAPIGDALITLKENVDTCYFGYKIVSFEPKYQKNEDLIIN